MTAQERKDTISLLEYLWKDEESHYHCGSTKEHIFVVLKRLAKGIGYRMSE